MYVDRAPEVYVNVSLLADFGAKKEALIWVNVNTGAVYSASSTQIALIRMDDLWDSTPLPHELLEYPSHIYMHCIQ